MSSHPPESEASLTSDGASNSDGALEAWTDHEIVWTLLKENQSEA